MLEREIEKTKLETKYILEDLIPENQSDYITRNFQRVRNLQQIKKQEGLSNERDRLTPVQVIGSYLDSLEEAKSEYFSEVKALANQYPEMDKDIAFIIAIPVVGFAGQSEQTIGRTLESFISQETSRRVEINCLVNKPTGESFDRSFEIIKDYRSSSPNISITSGKTELKVKAKSRPLMGKIRALQTDAILLRMYEAFKNTQDKDLPIILLADDDTEWINPQALENYRRAFESYSDLDLIIGSLRFDNREYPSVFFPPFYVADQLMYELPQLNKKLINDLSLGDRLLTEDDIRIALINIFGSSFTKGLQINIAFKPESYAAVGGAFDSSQDINEIDLMVRMISASALEKGKCNIGALGEEVLVYSSSRRALLEYLDGENRAPIQQWRSNLFGIRVKDRARVVRPNISGVFPIDQLNEEGLRNLTSAIEQQINSTLEEYILPSSVAGWYNDALNFYVEALNRIGLESDDYSLVTKEQDRMFTVQIIFVRVPQNLLDKISALQQLLISKGQYILENAAVSSDRLTQGFIVRPKIKNYQPVVFTRDQVIYGNVSEERKFPTQVRFIQLPK